MGDKTFTHKTAENAKPGDKPYKLSTGRGFYLLVMPAGGKLWRFGWRNCSIRYAVMPKLPDMRNTTRRRIFAKPWKRAASKSTGRP